MVSQGIRKLRDRRIGVTLVVALALAVLLVSAPGARAAAGPELDAKALQTVMLAQDLPTLQLLPVTATSHPFNGAAWQNKPIDLKKYGYVEREYLMSGEANVYGWVAGSDYHTQVLRDGPYATRVLVRRPANLNKWSGRVVVELMNTSAGYDWTAIWSALWESLLARHDVYVGITSKAAVFPGMQTFDAERYAGLAMANPLAPEDQVGGTLPSDGAGYDPNYSKLYENGLVWDIATQAGRLFKTAGPANPLKRAAKTVILSGESQQGNVLVSYYKWFTPGAYLKKGAPIFDGYLAECFVNANPQDKFPLFTQAPINQTEPLTNRLPDNDPQLGWVPARPVPFAAINSQWDYSAARGFPLPDSFNTKGHKAVFWDLAGCNHGWEWQYLYGDACAADLLKAGFWDPATYDWKTTPNNPEVPLYMAEKALYRDLLHWIKSRIAPPVPNHIESVANDPAVGFGEYRDAAVYDARGTAKGGLRFPMISVPVASYGEGRYTLTPPDGSAEIVPFSADLLKSLYPTKQAYVNKFTHAAQRLVQQRYLLASDAHKLVRQAKKAVIPD
jgi:hypothetical protein